MTPKTPSPEMPIGVLVVVHVPPSFRGLPKSEVRRKLSHPLNVSGMLDNIAQSIVDHFNKPVDHKALITAIAANMPTGEGGN
jgi:hypothetical protein